MVLFLYEHKHIQRFSNLHLSSALISRNITYPEKFLATCLNWKNLEIVFFSSSLKIHWFFNINIWDKRKWISTCFYFIVYFLWSKYLRIYVGSGKPDFKQKISPRVNQKKIKSSSKEYITFEFWPMKNIFQKLWENKSLVMACLQNCRG